MNIEGVERLKRKISAMPEKAKTAIAKTLASSGKDMADVAQRMAPVKSGALKNSIGYTIGPYKADNANVRGMGIGGGKHELAVTVHAGDATAWYARLVEFGTRPHINGGLFAGTQHPGSAPHPYFYPAYRLTKKQLKSRIRAAVSRAAKEAAKA